MKEGIFYMFINVENNQFIILDEEKDVILIN